MSKVRDELQRIYDRDGLLSPEVVVKEARKKSSPLHGSFDWDDKTAGHSWRLFQARKLIGRFRIHVEVEPDVYVHPRAFQAVPKDDDMSRYDYRSTADVMDNPEWKERVFRDCVRDMRALQHKYEALVDLDRAWSVATTKAVA